MKTNVKLRDEIFKIINNQIKNNDPPETSLTYNKLISEGFNEFQIKQMIWQCIAVELFEVMKNKKLYDEARYIKNLKLLPKEPFDLDLKTEWTNIIYNLSIQIVYRNRIHPRTLIQTGRFLPW